MPKEAQKPSNEPVIHVMPAEFRGGKMQMTPPPKPAVPPPLPPKPSPKPPVSPPKVPAKKRRLAPVLLIGLVFFVILIVAAVVVLLSLSKSTPVATNTATNTNSVNTEPVVEPECSEKKSCSGDFVCEKGKCVTASKPTAPVGGTDTDSDGLTDIEEILFGSDPRNADTDHDSYLDGNEVYHLYNPRGDAPSLLTDTGFAREFTDDQINYQMVYPSRWTTQLLDAPSEHVIFRVPTGEYVEVSKLSKEGSTSLLDWYLAKEPGVKSMDVTKITTAKGYPGLASPDKMTTYLDFGEAVYVLSYRLQEVTTINFLTTFQMMVASFGIKS